MGPFLEDIKAKNVKHIILAYNTSGKMCIIWAVKRVKFYSHHFTVILGFIAFQNDIFTQKRLVREFFHTKILLRCILFIYWPFHVHCKWLTCNPDQWKLILVCSAVDWNELELKLKLLFYCLEKVWLKSQQDFGRLSWSCKGVVDGYYKWLVIGPSPNMVPIRLWSLVHCLWIFFFSLVSSTIQKLQ